MCLCTSLGKDGLGDRALHATIINLQKPGCASFQYSLCSWICPFLLGPRISRFLKHTQKRGRESASR